ncbi:MAG: PEP-CTERM sorting domain-containing protein [Planctomycetaceae bacterium]|nr:PEP-CTERM sorting domain-containing protein [Planctomycetaceae bacterium]
MKRTRQAIINIRSRSKTAAALAAFLGVAILLSSTAESRGENIGFQGYSPNNYSSTSLSIFHNYGAGTDGGPGMSNTANRALPNTANRGFFLSKPDQVRTIVRDGKQVTQAKMTYNFGYEDYIFGAGGTHPLLDGPAPTGGDARNYLLNVKKKSEWEANATGLIPAATLDGLNSSNTPWLARAGATKAEDGLYQYLMARDDQWALYDDDNGKLIPPTEANEKSAYSRLAAALGMSYNNDQVNDFSIGKYSMNYIVTMWADEDAFFRPNRNQWISNTIAEGAPFVRGENTTGEEGWMPDPKWRQEWNAHVGGSYYSSDDDGGRFYVNPDPAEDAVLEQDQAYDHFYTRWWNNNDPKGNFPWTGIGYTYDWYYQNLDENGNPSMDWDAYWSQQDPDDDHYFGQGLAEYVMLQSDPTKPESTYAGFEVVDVQTTYNYLGGTDGQWGEIVPEPNTLTMFGMACLAGLGLYRRRR